MALIPSAVEGKLSAMAESFTVHEYKSAEKVAASIASSSSDWASTKDFMRQIKLLATLGLQKSQQQ